MWEKVRDYDCWVILTKDVKHTELIVISLLCGTFVVHTAPVRAWHVQLMFAAASYFV